MQKGSAENPQLHTTDIHYVNYAQRRNRHLWKKSTQQSSAVNIFSQLVFPSNFEYSSISCVGGYPLLFSQWGGKKEANSATGRADVPKHKYV